MAPLLSDRARRYALLAGGAVAAFWALRAAARAFLARDGAALVPAALRGAGAARRVALGGAGADAAVVVRRATRADVPAAAATLAAALADDAMVRVLTSLDAGARRAAVERVYAVLLRAAVPASRGLVVSVTDGADAVALWIPSGAGGARGACARAQSAPRARALTRPPPLISLPQALA